MFNVFVDKTFSLLEYGNLEIKVSILVLVDLAREFVNTSGT